MPTLSNGFESGTSGSAVTVANSAPPAGAGNAFDVADLGSGGTLQYTTTEVHSGALACEIASTASAQTYLGWSTSMGSQATVYWRGYYYFTANPSATIRLWVAVNGSTSYAVIALNSSGKILVDYGSASTNYVTFTGTIPTNQWFRIEGIFIASATVGQIGASLYDTADSTTATETHTSAADLNTGAADPDAYYWGISSSQSSVATYYIDDIGLSNSGYLGPSVFTGTGTAALTLTATSTGSSKRSGTPTAAVTIAATATGHTGPPGSAPTIRVTPPVPALLAVGIID